MTSFDEHCNRPNDLQRRAHKHLEALENGKGN